MFEYRRIDGRPTRASAEVSTEELDEAAQEGWRVMSAHWGLDRHGYPLLLSVLLES